MKNLFITLIAITIFTTINQANAQISIGPGIAYGTDINNIGFNLNGKYEINEKLAIAPSFTYFLKKDYVNWSSLDLNANYRLTNIENVGSLYAIGGIGATFWSFDGDEIIDLDFGDYEIPDELVGDYDTDTTEIGVNLGIGLNISTKKKTHIYPEIMYTFGDLNYLRFGAKIMFNL